MKKCEYINTIGRLLDVVKASEIDTVILAIEGLNDDERTLATHICGHQAAFDGGVIQFPDLRGDNPLEDVTITSTDGRVYQDVRGILLEVGINNCGDAAATIVFFVDSYDYDHTT